MKIALHCISWIALCASIAGMFVGIDLDLNFFSWVGTWHFQSVACVIGLLILLISSYYLSAISQNPTVLVVAFISCVMLMGAGIWAVTPEALGNPGHWLYRSSASPDWYRIGRLAIACFPFCILVLIYIRRSLNRAI